MNLADPATETPLAVGVYMATVRVSVRGSPPKSDVGCAFVADDTPEAREAAYKGAVTDALKRSLRHFGDQFGNSLYDRRNALAPASPGQAAPASPTKLEEMRRKVMELSSRLGVDEAQARSWVQKRYRRALNALSEQQLADAVRSLARELNRGNGVASAGRRTPRQAA